MNKTTINLEPLSYAMREEMKTLRTNILFCGSDKQVIMVTSSFMGEGKTTISTRLAVALSELKKKVLLLDLDLRKSVMVSRVHADNVKYGMSHFLSGQCTLANVVMSTNFPKLHIAFAGPSTPNPTELISGERFAKMMESLRSLYDYIIIDVPPLGMVVDAAIIAKNSDGAIMVMKSGEIKYRMAQEVKGKLEASGCPLLGVVLNQIDRKKNSPYYKKYYGKYYGKDYGRYESDGRKYDANMPENEGILESEIRRDLEK